MNDDDNDDDDNDGDDSDGDDDDDTSGYAPPPGSLRPNELSDVEEKAHYLPIATFFKIKFGKEVFDPRIWIQLVPNILI